MANSSESLQERQIMTKGVVKRITDDDGVAIRLKYVGTGTVTSVTVTTATNIVMITSDGGTDTYAFGTYNTVGKLVDAINADGIFEAKVLDSLRSLATASQFVNGAISLSYRYGIPFYDVLVDLSAAKYLAYRISPNRLMLKGKENVADKHRTHLIGFSYYANVNAGTADAVQVWDVDPTGSFETQLYSELSVDSTLTTISFNSYENKMTSLEDGHELVVLVKDATSLANGGYLWVSGEIE